MKFKLTVLDRDNLEWHLVIKTNLLTGAISLIERHESNFSTVEDCALCDLYIKERSDQ